MKVTKISHYQINLDANEANMLVDVLDCTEASFVTEELDAYVEEMRQSLKALLMPVPTTADDAPSDEVPF